MRVGPSVVRPIVAVKRTIPIPKKAAVKKIARETGRIGLQASRRGLISYTCINAIKAGFAAGSFWGLFKCGLIGTAPWSSGLLALTSGSIAISVTLLKRVQKAQKLAAAAVAKQAVKV